MKRRNFLKYTAPLTAAPLMLAGAPTIRPFATHKMLAALTGDCLEVQGRALVLIQLKGGNDGLNTVIPIAQYDTYANIRPTLKIEESTYLPLDNTITEADQVALNPALAEIKTMYEEGLVNIIQGVNYENPNLSHFAARDIHWTGTDGSTTETIYTGWMGRYLDAAFPGIAGNPIEIMQDPLGIQLGDSKPALGFASHNPNDTAINLYGQDPSGFFNLVNSVGGEPPTNIPSSEYGNELQYIMNVENSVEVYAERITTVFNEGSNSGVTYPDTGLGNQLKTIARLIDGGSKTKIFLASLDGFDTHAGQVVSGNSATGIHFNLLQTLSQAVKAFTDDLSNLGLDDKVLTATFSEFGRKGLENGALGTDHGAASNMMLFGPSVNPGLTGTNLNLSDAVNGGHFLEIQHDYRQVFSTLLQDWLGASDDMLATAFPLDSYSKIPIINTTAIAEPGCYGLTASPAASIPLFVQPINNSKASINWQTTSEKSVDYFEVQRSDGSDNFETIERVTANGSPSHYEINDNAPFSSISKYRIRQISNNGAIAFSEIKPLEIQYASIKSMRLAPNPTRFNSFVNLTANEAVAARLRVISMQGMIHRSELIQLQKGFNKIPLEVKRLSTGIYTVVLEDKQGRILGQEKLVVQQ